MIKEYILAALLLIKSGLVSVKDYLTGAHLTPEQIALFKEHEEILKKFEDNKEEAEKKIEKIRKTQASQNTVVQSQSQTPQETAVQKKPKKTVSTQKINNKQPESQFEKQYEKAAFVEGW
jgi:hypothetical protein